MMEKNATESQDDSNLMQDNTGRKFQSACHIWFCPTDEKIATELRRMAHDEREKVWADLSGNEKTSMFKQVVMEDPNEISEGLNQLQREVDSTKEKPAFDFARRQSPEYVQDRSFQLVFLRSCEYDGKRAGRLLIDHMETKRRLFGDSALGRDIRLSDLNTNDMKTLITGGIQFLHERDRAGRIVLYCRRSSMEFKERENFSRALFYSFMIALKDESVQKLGVVVIWDMMSEYPGGHDYEADRMAIQTVSILPVRPVARYFLYNSEMWDHVIDVLNQLNTAHARARTRSIKGSYDEVMQALACLGISRHSIPAKKNGEINSIGLNQWVEARKKEELSSTAGLRCLGPLTVKRHLHGRLSFGGPVKRRKIDM